MRLARKLALAFLCAIVVVLIANAYLRVQRELEVFEADMRRDHRVIARALLPTFVRVWRENGEDRALDLLEEANRGISNVAVRWVWFDASDDERRPRVAAPAIAEARGKSETIVVDRAGDGTLTTYAAAELDGRSGALELTESLAEEREYIRATVLRATAVTGAIGVICGAIAWGLGLVLIGRPVREMIDKARRIGAGDFEGVLPVRGGDELAELAAAMNSMCEQLSREIGARQKAQEQLRHAERLTTVGKLASGVAHELGTPINVISARAKPIVAGRTDAGGSAANARIIVEQCERMTNIIRQLLEFARSNTSAKRTNVDLVAIARETCDLLEPIAEKSGTVLEKPPADQAPIEVLADRTQLQQVISNLILNAIQSMPRSGRANVSLSRKAPPHGEAGELACIAVRDQGAGIASEVLPRIFEPFFTTKAVGEGTGLGLSVAHGIVQEHGGFIDVETEVGKGTCFSVYLPLRRTP